MENVIDHAGAGGWLAPAAYVAVLSVAVSCVSLVLLHVVSPEFAPSWRMVSEYANGPAPLAAHLRLQSRGR